MFCPYCGEEINDNAYVCTACGCRVGNNVAPVVYKDTTFVVLVKIFMILGCVAIGWTLVPLAWCIPMTVKVFRCMKAGIPMSTGFKVCTLLFVSLVAGIIMLCVDDSRLSER